MTWFQVEFDGGLPQGLCQSCSESAIAAINFRQLCKESRNQWTHATSFMNNVKPPSDEDKIYYIYYNTQTVTKGATVKVIKKDNALVRFDLESDHGSDYHFSDAEQELQAPRPVKVPRSSFPWQCPDCDKKFTSSLHLNTHLKNTKKRACDICARILPKFKFPMHLHKAHKRILYHCETCFQIFQDECSLSQHKEKYHGKGYRQCKVCGKGFVNERSLCAHMYNHSLFFCGACGRDFENRNCFAYHQRQCESAASKTISNEYTCDHCGNSYTKKPSLRIHIIQKHLNVLPYVCATCGKRTSTIAHLRSHEKVHTVERKVYQCDCGAQMRTELGFQLHKRIHTGEKPYECSECGDKFLSASRRLDHIKRRHRPAKDMPHGCEECSARFVRPFELRKHYISVHTTKKDVIVGLFQIGEESYCPAGACVSCASAAMAAQEFRLFVRNSQNIWLKAINALNEVPKTNGPLVRSICAFVKPDNLHIHTVKDYTAGDTKTMLNRLKNRLTKKTEVERKARTTRTGPSCKCPDCGKTFYSPYFLRMHLKNSGFKEACAHCAAIVRRGNEMLEHLTKVHGETAYLCNHCPLLFPDKFRLEKHEKNAHKFGSWTCCDCGRSFYGKTSFELHAQMHTVRTCRTCGTQFSNRSCYRIHRVKCEPDARPNSKSLPRNKRSNIRDPATFTCDYCGKSYHSRPQLKNHIIWIHMDVRPHQCQWCGKRFYTPSRLAEHSIVHTRERNFGCDICGAKLVSKMAAIYHRRRHTGEKPYECEDCGERFISSSRKTEHAKRRHDRGPKMQCVLCSASFVRSKELRKHVEKVHKTTATLERS